MDWKKKTINILRLIVCLSLLCVVPDGCSCRKKPPPAPVKKTVKKAKPRPPGRHDDVVICLVNQESLLLFDREWPLPYDWHAIVLNNLSKAGARVVGANFEFSSRNPDPRGGVRIENVINHAATQDKPMRTALLTSAGVPGTWPMLSRPNDSVRAYWATYYARLFEQSNDSARLAALLGAEGAPERGISLEAALAALFLKLDPDKIYKVWNALIARGGKYLELPFGKKLKIPVEEYGGRYAFEIRPYGPAGAFPTFTYRDALLADLDPAPIATRMLPAEDVPGNASEFLLLANLQAAAFPPRLVGTFDMSGIVPTSTAVTYSKGLPSSLFIAGIKYGSDNKGAGMIFSLENPDETILEGKFINLKFAPLGMSVNMHRDEIEVFDGATKAVLRLNPKTFKEIKSYPLAKEDQLLAGVAPFVGKDTRIPPAQVQMIHSTATDTTYVLVPYTNVVLSFRPDRETPIMKHAVPEKALRMDFTEDFARIFVYTNVGKMFTAETANMYFYELPAGGKSEHADEPDRKSGDKTKPAAGLDKLTEPAYKWAEPVVYRFQALPGAGEPATASAIGTQSATATAQTGPPDYISLFLIDNASKQILGVDWKGGNRARRLPASPALIKTDFTKEEKIKVEPRQLIHAANDRRLFVLMGVEAENQKGLAPYELGIIDPYARGWLSTHLPLNLPGIPTTFTAGGVTVFITPTDSGLHGAVVDLNGALLSFRYELFKNIMNRVVLLWRQTEEQPPAYLVAGHEKLGTIPDAEISAAAVQNLINGDFRFFVK